MLLDTSGLLCLLQKSETQPQKLRAYAATRVTHSLILAEFMADDGA